MNKFQLGALALLASVVLFGCAEEKVDPKIEQAVIHQNQGMAERDAKERGMTIPTDNAPKTP